MGSKLGARKIWKHLRKTIAAALTLLLIVESPTYGGSLSPGGPASHSSLQHQTLHFKSEFLDRRFYLERDALTPSSESGKPVCFLIGDAHGSREAQRSIFGLITWLRNHQSKVFFLAEGVHGELNLQPFGVFPYRAREKIAQDWFRRGELSPIEASFLTHPESGRVFGLEGRDLYERNIKIYWRAKENQKRAEIILDGIFDAVRLQLAQTFKPEFLKLNSFETFLITLGRSPGRTIQLLVEALREVPLESLADFKSRFPAFHAFMSVLEPLVRQPELQISREIREWLENPTVTEGLSSEYLPMYEFLMQRPGVSREMAGLWTLETPIRHAVAIEASQDDLRRWRRFGTARDVSRGLLNFGPVPQSDASILENQLRLAETFYRLALARDDMFQARFREVAREHPDAKAMVILAGGFHMDRLRRFLEAEQYPHLVLKPKMERPTESDYETKMRQLASIFTSTVVPLFAFEESDYAARGLRGNRLSVLLSDLEAETGLRHELRARGGEPLSPHGKLRRQITTGIAVALAGGLSGCAKLLMDWGKTPEALLPDTRPKPHQQVLVIPQNIENALRDTNPVVLARLEVYIKWLAHLKTLPEFADLDMNIGLETQFTKIIGNINRGKISKKQQILRDQLSKFVSGVIGDTSGNISETLAEQNEALGNLATSVGDALATAAADKLAAPEQPKPVDYDPVWGDLGININFLSTPPLSVLDSLVEYLEKNPNVPLVSLNTPFGFSIGPSSANIAQASFNRQVVLDLIKSLIHYRRVLDEQTRGVIDTYQALELANAELLRLMTEANLLIQKRDLFKTLSSVTDNETERVQNDLNAVSDLIRAQLKAISILQGSLDLFFMRSTKDERTWLIQSGVGERSAFTAAENGYVNPLPGTDNLPGIPFMILENNLYHLDPKQMPGFIESLVNQGVISAESKDWFDHWAAHQTSLVGQEVPRQAIREKANYNMANTPDIAATEELKVDIAFTEESIRQHRLRKHTEFQFGVDSSISASPIDKVNTWSWSVPLTLSIKVPISTRNTELSIRELRVQQEISRIAIEQALLDRRDTTGTIADTIDQNDALTKALVRGDQANAQSLLAEHGQVRGKFKRDPSGVPAAIQRAFYDRVLELMAPRFKIHALQAKNYWEYWRLATYIRDNETKGPDFPKALEVPEKLNSNAKDVAEKGERPRSEFRQVHGEAQIVSQIQNTLWLYSDTLPAEGEIAFGGSRLQFKKESDGVRLVKANLPLLKYVSLPLILILIEEYLHGKALEKHVEHHFVNEHEQNYALFHHLTIRILKRIVSEGLDEELIRFAPEPADDFAALRILKQATELIREKKIDPKTDDRALRFIAWTAMSIEAGKSKEKPRSKRVILVTRSEAESEALAEKTQLVAAAYRSVLHRSAGLGMLPASEPQAAPGLKEKLMTSTNTVDSAQRSILGFVKRSPKPPPPAALAELLLDFKLSDVQALIEAHGFSLDQFNSEILRAYRAQDEAALHRLRRSLNEPAEFEEPVHIAEAVTPTSEIISAAGSFEESEGIISLQSVPDDMVFSLRPENPSGARSARRPHSVIRMLSQAAVIVLAILSLSFASPSAIISRITSSLTTKQTLPASQPTTQTVTTQPAAIAPAASVRRYAAAWRPVRSALPAPWFTAEFSAKLELNPQVKPFARNHQIPLAPFIRSLDKQPSQVVVYHVPIPETLVIGDAPNTSTINLPEALAQIAERFERLKKPLSDQDANFARTISPFLKSPWNFDEWKTILEENRNALVRVSPVTDTDAWRQTAIPLDQLLANAFAALAHAEQELNEKKTGSVSRSTYRIFVWKAFREIRKLAEALDRYRDLRVVVPIERAEQLILDERGLSFSESGSGSPSFSVLVKLSDEKAARLSQATLVLESDRGAQTKLPPGQVEWVRLGNSTYLGFSKQTFQPQQTRRVFIELLETEEPEDAEVSASDQQPDHIAVPRRFRVDLTVPYFSRVSAGQAIGEARDVLLERRIHELETALQDLERERAAFADNLYHHSGELPDVGPSDLLHSEHGISQHAFDERAAALKEELVALKAGSARIPIRAGQAGLLLPPDPKIPRTGNDRVIAVIAPFVDSRKQNVSRNELRLTGTVAFLRELVARPQDHHWNGGEFPKTEESSWSTALQSAENRRAFVKTLDRFPGIRQKLRSVTRSAKPVLAESTLLITDAGSFSVDGFKVWSRFLPPSDKLHWIIVADASVSSRSEFREFRRNLAALGYFPSVVRSRSEAERQIAQMNRLWQPTVIKWITDSEPGHLPFTRGEEGRAFLIRFDSHVLHELEPWFYRLILEAASVPELLSRYQSIEPSQTGSWTILKFDFNRLVVELETGEHTSRSA